MAQGGCAVMSASLDFQANRLLRQVVRQFRAVAQDLLQRVGQPNAREVLREERVMAGPVLETKLYVPSRRGGVVRRRRLSERLERGGRSEADTRLRTGWFREDDPSGRVADERSAAWTANSVAVT